MAYRIAKKELARAQLIMSEEVSQTRQKPTKVGSVPTICTQYSRAQAFERDYPAFLLALASSVRTGLDPLQAMIEVRKLFDQKSEVRSELEKFKILIDSGASETQALSTFASSIQHPDIALFRTTFLLSRQQGSSIGDCLHRLAKVTRHRQSFRRKVKSAVAMQKLSAFGIAACAILICLVQAVGNPKIVSDAISNSIGVKLLTIGMLLIVFGLVWMLKMTKSKI